MDPAPPPTTVVDPQDSHGTTDLLDHGPGPWLRLPTWRPTRRRIGQAAAVLVVLVFVVSGVRVALSHYLDVRADEAAVKEVHLAFDRNSVRIVSLESSLRETKVRLVSRGRHPVTLTAVQMVGGAQSDHLKLVMDGRGTDVILPPGRGCAMASLVTPPTAFRLTLRTYRGTPLVRTFALGSVSASQYAQDERMRCGYPPLALALGFDIERSEVVGRTLVVHLRLFNTSRGDLAVTGLRLSPGLAASGFRLPVHVVPSGHPSQDASRVVLRVRVSDCDAFRASQAIPDRAEPSLTLTVRERFATETVDTALISENDGILPTEVWATGFFRDRCGMRSEY